MNWTYTNVVGGGERWNLIGKHGRSIVTVVRLPGTLYRTFWPDGNMTDTATPLETFGQIAEAYGCPLRPPGFSQQDFIPLSERS